MLYNQTYMSDFFEHGTITGKGLALTLIIIFVLVGVFLWWREGEQAEKSSLAPVIDPNTVVRLISPDQLYDPKKEEGEKNEDF